MDVGGRELSLSLPELRARLRAIPGTPVTLTHAELEALLTLVDELVEALTEHRAIPSAHYDTHGWFLCHGCAGSVTAIPGVTVTMQHRAGCHAVKAWALGDAALARMGLTGADMGLK